MEDMGTAKQILGIRIIRDRQAKKLWLLLQRFHMENVKAVNTPLATHFKLSFGHSPSNEAKKTNMSKVPYAFAMGSLMYAMVCIRPNIAHVVGIRALECCEMDLEGAVAWQSKLQKCVALSTTEAEFIAIKEACKELLWVKKLLKELGFVHDKHCLFCDSQSAIHLDKNLTFHSRSKHIDVRYYWIRDALDAKLLDLKLVVRSSDSRSPPHKDKVITLGPNELSNLVSSYCLDGRNYLQLAQYIRTTLKERKKLSHIEGNGSPRDDPKFEAWDDEDSLIMT
ncbi:hypothetical protein CR513_14062, partial [Mucuna pruriens]